MGDGHNLEESVAHLLRTVDDLSAEVARQGAELDRLSRHVRLLLERAAEAEAHASGGVIMGDERPPHY